MIFAQWPAPDHIVAVTTTRDGGVSNRPYDSFNLATHVGDDPAHVARNRERLAQQLSLPAQPQWLTQVHGCEVVSVGGPLDVEADASYTAETDRVCAILTADCLPVLFCDSLGRQVAAAHAGWAGLLAGVLEQTLARFEQGSGVMAWLGPAISQSCYEVGAEVREAFLDAGSPDLHEVIGQAFVASDRAGHWMADLYALARVRLQASGVSCYGGTLCTATDSQRFFSYRRDGVTGRMASLIYIKS